MTDRLLAERIRAEVLNAGMDLVGFAPVERWRNGNRRLPNNELRIMKETANFDILRFSIRQSAVQLGL